MPSPHKIKPYIGSDRSKAFLFGLYVGLSLLLFVSWLDPARNSLFHKATNIYGVQALAGAILGGWRIWKRAESPKASPAIPSIWICIGLAAWAIGQPIWTWASIRIANVPYPWWSDIFYLASDLFWLMGSSCPLQNDQPFGGKFQLIILISPRNGSDIITSSSICALVLVKGCWILPI